MATTLLIATFSPFPSLTLTLPSETPLSEIPSHLPKFLLNADLALSLPSGTLPLDARPLSTLWSSTESASTDDVEALSSRLVSLRLTPRLRGGKGGFGSQLRAAGGRMSSQKTSNNDSCRDLNGRRLSTIKEAKAMAAYLESEPERKKAQQEAQRVKLERLERQLGIDGKGEGNMEDASAGVKRRFDDTEYLEESREIVDNVKSAVLVGMLKKKKLKMSLPTQEASSSTSSKAVEVPLKYTEEAIQNQPTNVAEKVLESSTSAPSASLSAIGA